MTPPANESVRKRRDSLRAAGLRPLQIWMPDTNQPGFSEVCRRQSIAVAQADPADQGLMDFIDAAVADADEWLA
ncbi:MULTISPECIES: antitoxin MazE family protein [unclassified Thiocapsa]|uniref:antitoxin MazE family protein n=1 Tax=unclassified Thiocapsa TaxID=2641286 RepID=UPI0035B3F745